jgi:iron complex outermembrane receptor protein
MYRGSRCCAGRKGTLYGKNTIGGAINVVTQRPKFADFGGEIRGLLGSGDRFELVGSLNVPVGERAALRVSGARLYQDGYVDLIPSGRRLGNRNRWTVRAAFAADLTDRLSVDLSADYLRAREQGGATTLVAINPAGSQVLANARLGFTYDQRFLPATPFQAFGDPQVSNAEVFGTAATIQWQAADNLTFKSISAYRGVDSFFTRDGDQSPLLLLYTQSNQKQRQFTQELQVIGDLFSERLKYLIGGFYGSEDGQDTALLQTRQVSVNIGGNEIDTRSYAVFAQATLDVTDKLSLTGGARYTNDRKTYLPDIFIAAVTPGSGGPPPFVVRRPLVPNVFVARTFDKVTYRAAAQYQWTGRFMTYASYSTGFKSGGFVQRNSATVPALPSFGPETVAVLEAGFKLDAFNRRLRLNGAAFTNRYRDLQITVLQPTGLVNAPITQNAGRAKINGAELDVEAVLGYGFVLTGGVSYLDAKYTELASNAIGIDLRKRLVRAPTWSGNVSAIKSQQVGDGELTARLDMNFTSRSSMRRLNLSPQARYAVFNGTLNYD